MHVPNKCLAKKNSTSELAPNLLHCLWGKDKKKKKKKRKKKKRRITPLDRTTFFKATDTEQQDTCSTEVSLFSKQQTDNLIILHAAMNKKTCSLCKQ